ncbi:MAG: tRNA uridine-5-carboxymethylaminomethyl(34) synthesis enzyme MnmG [Actinobacteria bacterium]|nr:tRNA uridine-5-carboxymethylaminomethyl(34) synthesis enzyme MnmG [Actinomycetota bacterium]
MRGNTNNTFDIIVVGAGHAGCEAALATARMGLKTLILTINVDKIALMPCNPSIGGIGKSQLVREIDAMGGQMGKTADKTFIQIKNLNSSKGPAVQALRTQIDKKEYEIEMKKTLENTANLTLRQGTVSEIIIEDGNAVGVKTESGVIFKARSVVVTSGTFLRGRIIIGDKDYPAGRMGEYPAMRLSENLLNIGFKIDRFQTATPPRVDGRTVDFSKTSIQNGSGESLRFSFWDAPGNNNNIPCHLTYTNELTHKIIAENIRYSPIKSGMVDTHGPRHCPSIDRKVINFPEKTRHPVFIEPEGALSNEMYLQGLTTSMPALIQQKIVNTVDGLEDARIVRPGYAVEYDYIIPDQLNFTLESKLIGNLYFAGQINGTSGYEEAAAQGFIAGVNAAQKIRGNRPIIMTRENSYIGVMIDDLLTKELIEPYRMYTSRAEYRLLLRSDNADVRLSKFGLKLGLITKEQFAGVQLREEKVKELISFLKSNGLNPGHKTNQKLISVGTKPLDKPNTLYQILKRPEVSISRLMREFYNGQDRYDEKVFARTEMMVKYEGYINRQVAEAKKLEGIEKYIIPLDLDYYKIMGITYEAREKLSNKRPNTLGQASRIAGVSPVDISVLSIILKKKSGKQL